MGVEGLLVSIWFLFQPPPQGVHLGVWRGAVGPDCVLVTSGGGRRKAEGGQSWAERAVWQTDAARF